MGRRVRQARRSAGYVTAAAFASAVGLSAAVVQRLERGHTEQMMAVLRVLRPLHDLHGHSVDRLLFGLKPAPDSLAG
jgi:transcriptional regulator with XRE-family HTH domain